MAKNDIKIRSNGGLTSVPTYTWQTKAGSTAIYAGEPVTLEGAGLQYAALLVDGEGILGTDPQFLGITKSDSTHTASADGVVEVYIPIPGLIYEAKAKTASTVDTQAEINALCGDKVIFDVTGGVVTVDAAAGNGATKPLLIIGGNPEAKTVYFMIDRGTNVANGA